MGGSRGLGSAGTETVAERDGGMDCSAGGLGPGPHSCRFRYEATAPLFGDLCPSSHVGLSWMGDQITRLREHPEISSSINDRKHPSSCQPDVSKRIDGGRWRFAHDPARELPPRPAGEGARSRLDLYLPCPGVTGKSLRLADVRAFGDHRSTRIVRRYSTCTNCCCRRERRQRTLRTSRRFSSRLAAGPGGEPPGAASAGSAAPRPPSRSR